MPRPSFSAPALYVSAPDCEIRPGVNCSDEAGQISWVVGEVSVHLAEDCRVQARRCLESGGIGLAEARLLRPVENRYPFIFRGEPTGDPASSIRGSIIHDQNAETL